VGSYGFDLEEHREEMLPVEDESTLAQALAQTQELLQSAASGSDDELTDAASGHDSRVVAAVRAFLQKLIDHEAVCAVAIGDRSFGFPMWAPSAAAWRDSGRTICTSRRRRSRGNSKACCRSDGRSSSGSKRPVRSLPEDRPGVVEPAAINQHLYQRTNITVMETRVGQGHPRYVLTSRPCGRPARDEAAAAPGNLS